MFAIIEIGGKQYKVQEKEVFRTEKVEPADNKVLLIFDGSKTHIGAPYLDSARVELKLLSTGKGEKLHTFKMKAKKRYKRNIGHRQQFNEVEVVKISA